MEKQSFFGHEKYMVHSSYVDFSKRLTAVALLGLFQESACLHSDSLGVGRNYLNDKGLFWALSRITIELGQMPERGDEVVVKTWPKAMDSVFSYRDFLLLNSKDEEAPLAKATSVYVLLDTAARRPQNIEPYTASVPLVTSENAIEARPDKIDALPCAWNYSKGVVRYSDIDMNGQVNVVKYLEWILDSYNWEHHQSNILEKVELNYIADAIAGEAYVVNMASKGRGVYLNNVVREEDQKELVRARIQWAKR